MGGGKNSDARPELNWQLLQTFLAVARVGSISGAAKALGLSQPTVSGRLTELEAALGGVQLCVRRASGVVLTDAGREALEQAAAMNQAARALSASARRGANEAKGRVRIVAPDGLATVWLAPRLGAFLERNPGIRLSLDVGFWPNSPVRDDLDITIAYERSNDPNRIVRPLGHAHYVPVGARSYVARHGAPRTMAEMAHHRGFRHSAFMHQRERWSDEMRAADDRNSESALESNSSMAIIAAIHAGAGLGIVPTFALTEPHDLMLIPISPVVSIEFFASFDKSAARVARIRRVYDWLREIFEHPCFAADYVRPATFGLAEGA